MKTKEVKISKFKQDFLNSFSKREKDYYLSIGLECNKSYTREELKNAIYKNVNHKNWDPIVTKKIKELSLNYPYIDDDVKQFTKDMFIKLDIEIKEAEKFINKTLTDKGPTYSLFSSKLTKEGINLTIGKKITALPLETLDNDVPELHYKLDKDDHDFIEKKISLIKNDQLKFFEQNPVSFESVLIDYLCDFFECTLQESIRKLESENKRNKQLLLSNKYIQQSLLSTVKYDRNMGITIKTSHGLFYSQKKLMDSQPQEILDSTNLFLKDSKFKAENVKDYLNKVDEWRSNLTGKEAFYLLKMFGYITCTYEAILGFENQKSPKVIGENSEGNKVASNLEYTINGDGTFNIKLNSTPDFLKFFCKKDKKSQQITVREKEQFEKWLKSNLNLDLPVLSRDNKLSIFRPFSLSGQTPLGNTSRERFNITLKLDPQFIKSDYEDGSNFYRYSMGVLDDIKEEWKERKKTKEWKKLEKDYKLGLHLDSVPILFMWVILEIYYTKKNKKTDTIQTLLDKNLNIRLGDLKKKITEKLRKNKVSLQTDFIYDKTLSLVFSIYTDLSIFSSFPKLIKNRMLWEFRFKKKYFTPQSK
jgi:hypothetical protein